MKETSPAMQKASHGEQQTLDDPTQRLARHLQRLHQQCDKNQQRIADACGVAESTVSDALNGNKIPRNETIKLMVPAMGGQLDDELWSMVTAAREHKKLERKPSRETEDTQSADTPSDTAAIVNGEPDSPLIEPQPSSQDVLRNSPGEEAIAPPVSPPQSSSRRRRSAVVHFVLWAGLVLLVGITVVLATGFWPFSRAGGEQNGNLPIASAAPTTTTPQAPVPTQLPTSQAVSVPPTATQPPRSVESTRPAPVAPPVPTTSSSTQACRQMRQYRVKDDGDVLDEKGIDIGDASVDDHFNLEPVQPPSVHKSRYYGTVVKANGTSLTGFVDEAKLERLGNVCA